MDTHISQWLAQRHSTWLLCSELANAQKKAKPVTLKKITVFCQTLMDYVSLGHFNVYEKLTHAALKNNLPLDKQLLEDIGSTTDDVLHFNEKYTDPNHLETWVESVQSVFPNGHKGRRFIFLLNTEAYRVHLSIVLRRAKTLCYG